jgi:hypothetical protein
VDGARSVTNQRQAGCGVENQGDACLGPERRLLYYDNVMFVIEQVQRIKAQSSSAASPPAFLWRNGLEGPRRRRSAGLTKHHGLGWRLLFVVDGIFDGIFVRYFGCPFVTHKHAGTTSSRFTSASMTADWKLTEPKRIIDVEWMDVECTAEKGD